MICRLSKEEKRLSVTFEKIQTKYREQDRTIKDLKSSISAITNRCEKRKERKNKESEPVRLIIWGWKKVKNG